MTNAYKKAYTEVLEIIKYFPIEEYFKIPKDKIEFYKENMDKNYNFHIDPNIDLDKQNISKETNSILVALFKECFATERQKEVLNSLLKQNQQKLEEEKLDKYNSDNMFIKKKTDNRVTENVQTNENETSLVEVKENFFVKFVNFIKKFLEYRENFCNLLL